MPSVGQLGTQLEMLFDQLGRAGLKVGPRDRIHAVALVADVLAHKRVDSIAELGPWLAPLLARSPADRERFFQVLQFFSPASAAVGSGVADRTDRTIADAAKAGDRKLLVTLTIASLILCVLTAVWFWPQQTAAPPTPRLRTALIEQLEWQRGEEIRAALRRLVDGARLSGDTRRDDAVTLRISQESPKDQVPAGELLQDEVFVDFLARGRIEDFALPNTPWLERLLPRSFLNRIGLPELSAIAVAVTYAVAALVFTPRETIVVPGSWMPIVLLMIGGISVLVASSPSATYAFLRSAFYNRAVFWLAVPIAIATIALLLWLDAESTETFIAVLSKPFPSTVALLLAAGTALLIAGLIAPHFGLPIGRHDASLRSLAALLFIGISLLGLLFLALTEWPAFAMALGVVTCCAAGWIAASFASDHVQHKLPVNTAVGSLALLSIVLPRWSDASAVILIAGGTLSFAAGWIGNVADIRVTRASLRLTPLMAAILTVSALWLGLVVVDALAAGTIPGRERMLERLAAIVGLIVPLTLSLLFAHVLPQQLPQPRPLSPGKHSRLIWGATCVGGALLPILLAAWLAAYVSSSSGAISKIPGGATAVADAAGRGVAAVGGVDGKVRVFRLKNRSAVPVMTIDVGASAVTGLSVRATKDSDPMSPIVLAATTADGKIHLFDALSGDRRVLPPKLAELKLGVSKVRLILGDGAVPFALHESEDGRLWLTSDLGTVQIGEAPSTSVVEIEPGRIAISNLSGTIWLAQVTAGNVPRVEELGPEEQRLPGGLRQLAFDAPTKTLTALGVDGTIVRVPLRDGRLLLSEAARSSDARLALGTPVTQNRAGSTRTGAARPSVSSSSSDILRWRNTGGQTDWDTVPIFFGTDRERQDQSNRIAYSSGRGRRLELGGALVTVPKAHQVPNIERPWSVQIPIANISLYQEEEDAKKHFVIQEIRAVSREDNISLIRDRLSGSQGFKDQMLVIIHDADVSFDDALLSSARMVYDLKYDGGWPASGSFGYPYSRDSAMQSEFFMKKFISLLLNDTGAKGVSFVAYGMGAQVLMQALRTFDRSVSGIARVGEIILVFPDIDRDSFAFLASQIRGIGRGITMYVSSSDAALGVARRLAGGVPRAGDVPTGLGPLIVEGVDTIDMSDVSMQSFSRRNPYLGGVMNDMYLILQTGERPPDVRLPILARVTDGRGFFGDIQKVNIEPMRQYN
jgi:esterase/lipase superfamily enzyme